VLDFIAEHRTDILRTDVLGTDTTDTADKTNRTDTGWRISSTLTVLGRL